MVEVLDDRHFHAGGLETDEALVGVAQQRRRQALDQFLRMGVEGDDRRPRPRALSGTSEFPQQVQMTAVQSIEDAHRQVEAPEFGLKGGDAGQDGHAVLRVDDAQTPFRRLSGSGVGLACDARAVFSAPRRDPTPRVHEDLLRHEPAAFPRPHADQRPIRCHEPHPCPGFELGPLRRLDLLPA